jgi:hypothetical protein
LMSLTMNSANASDQDIPITSKIFELLHAQKARTGVSSTKLLKGRGDVPEGLTRLHIAKWLRGDLKTTRPRFLEYVIWEWEQLPDKIPRVQITAERMATLRAERDRTGIASMALLWGTQDERPEGLSATLINSWLEGRTKSARQDHWVYTVERWQRLPDAV